MKDIDKLIETIRNDERVGRGSCSFIDECWSDGDIVDELSDFNTIEEALEFAHEIHGVFAHKCDDVRNA